MTNIRTDTDIFIPRLPVIFSRVFLPVRTGFYGTKRAAEGAVPGTAPVAIRGRPLVTGLAFLGGFNMIT